MIAYGALVWAHTARGHNEKLRRLNRMAINTFCNIPKSTPTRMLEISLNIMPLDLFMEQEALKAYSRLHNVLEFGWSGIAKRKTFNVSHMKYWGDEVEKFVRWNLTRDSIKELVWNNLFKVDLDVEF